MEERRERADAARNRQAILRAAEELLRRHPPEQVSIERVAAEAGVGKGTVFHRFGSRTGLMRELMNERARELEQAVAEGPPPLGPGAPPAERLVAFLAEVAALAARNGNLLAAHEHAVLTSKSPEPRESHPIYLSWHRHVTALIAEGRPDVDAGLIAHMLLGVLHMEPVASSLRAGAHERLAASYADLVRGLLGGSAGRG
ncbi:TetR/AcrR family transcriptional regulator [Actinomadura sp. ATCC 31491]|uniref:TetR/AcrR family transcriptional regulator n=1 Tax=Actinomadura luzonensis TaxID=2805427 RepID=A0ABT0FPC5_9ACTN|nr:TetR/AcrR family transcriptional regulator [Actinomadura luzonensis]MCK2214124.1 TetR/AcrR family transcriptional regulator [Actinomadura luzonensis]